MGQILRSTERISRIISFCLNCRSVRQENDERHELFITSLAIVNLRAKPPFDQSDRMGVSI